jgi:cytosine/adenosine deaminase-related metal-dependent hydrolase
LNRCKNGSAIAQANAEITLYAARGRLIPFNSNSPTGSTCTAFSTATSTRGLMSTCPGWPSLTPGKRADLILIRATDLNIAPLAQIETTVVQSAAAANVDTVMIDGRIIKRAGHLKHLDVPEIVRRAERSALRIRQGAGSVLKPVSEAIGNPVFCAAC